MRLLLDCDNVLSNFVGPCLDILQSLTNQTYALADVDQWDIMKALGVTKALSDTAYRLMREPGFCETLPVFPGAVEGVKRLSELVDVYIVTAPIGGRHWAYERELWLDRHFGIPRNRIISTSAKHLISGDVLVDDKTEILADWMRRHAPSIAVQWMTPHNRKDNWFGLATNNWDELYGIVRGYGATLGMRQPRRGFHEP